MTLVQLRHLIALARTGSFSRAAEQLHLTQPALSRSVQALERELGAPLLDRIGWRSELTPLGQEVLRRAQQLCRDADELTDSHQRLQEGRGGQLRIGMGSGPGALLMTPLLMRMASEYPQVRLVVARGSTARLEQGLRDRTLDAAVVDALSLQPAPDLRLSMVREMRGALMVRRGHPLTRRRRAVAFADLLRYPIASTPLGDEVARSLVEAYGPAAHPENFVTLQCEELSSLIEVTRRSDAVLLAVRAVAADLVELDLQARPRRTAQFALITLDRRSEPPLLRVLRELIDTLLHD